MKVKNKNKERKEPFVFQSVELCLDWFSFKKHEIKDEDYTYFKLNRRYGPSWWLYGMKTVDKPTYHWEETEIGEISNADLSRFIEWAKTETGSRIVKIDMISGCFDIFEEVGGLLNLQPQKAEAIKEFAEKLKKKQFCFGALRGEKLVSRYAVDIKDIDNLVKEMVGDD